MRQCQLSERKDASDASWFVVARDFMASSTTRVVPYATKVGIDGSFVAPMATCICIFLVRMVLTVGDASRLVRIVREGGHRRRLVPRGRARFTLHLPLRREASKALARSSARLLVCFVFGLLLFACHATLFSPDATASSMKGDDMMAVTNVVPEHDHCAN
eukprot:COSAG06_NODE_21829_length_744_cov_0.717829_1_plen_159_part_01